MHNIVVGEYLISNFCDVTFRPPINALRKWRHLIYSVAGILLTFIIFQSSESLLKFFQCLKSFVLLSWMVSSSGNIKRPNDTGDFRLRSYLWVLISSHMATWTTFLRALPIHPEPFSQRKCSLYSWMFPCPHVTYVIAQEQGHQLITNLRSS